MIPIIPPKKPKRNRVLDKELLSKIEAGDAVNWEIIARNYSLNEEFIRKYEIRFSWYCLGKDQKLSEAFIIEFERRLDWKILSEYQELSEDFIYKYSDKIDFVALISNKNLKNYSEEMQDYILIQTVGKLDFYIKKNFTDYMKAQYENYGFLL